MTPTDEEDESPLRGKGPSLPTALICYGALAVLATFTLDGKMRLVVWIFLGWLAFRTYLASLRKP